MTQVYDVKVSDDGKIEFRQNEKLHRLDGPAVINKNGDKSWYKNGLLHREDGPAIEWKNGDKSWYKNGLLYREDGPAIEWKDGDKSWYLNGFEHSKASYYSLTQPVKELSIQQLEDILGYKIKVVK